MTREGQETKINERRRIDEEVTDHGDVARGVTGGRGTCTCPVGGAAPKKT